MVSIDERVVADRLNIKVTLREGATPDEAMRAVDTVCTALRSALASVERLRCLMGKVMVEVQDRELFKPAFTSFEQWTQDVAKRHNLSRATIRESIMVARRLPNLTPEQAEHIPMTNLALVARAVKADGSTDAKTITDVLKQAATTPVGEFREKLTTQGLIEVKSQPEGYTTLRIVVNDRVAKQWRDVVEDQDAGKVFARILKAYLEGEKAKVAEKVMTAGRVA